MGSQTVTVTFAPDQVREYQGDLVVVNDVDDQNNTLPVSGMGTTNPYFGTWTAISFHGQPMNTYIADPESISCGTPDFEYAMEHFSITLDGTALALVYAEKSRTYMYTYDSEGSCATRTLEDTVPYVHSLDQKVPYAFDASHGDRIHYEMMVDGEFLAMTMDFALLDNGNLALVMTHVGDGESHGLELQRM